MTKWRPWPDRKGVALAFEALASDDTTSEAVMHLNLAKNWDEFCAAMKLFVTPDAEYHLRRYWRATSAS